MWTGIGTGMELSEQNRNLSQAQTNAFKGSSREGPKVPFLGFGKDIQNH